MYIIHTRISHSRKKGFKSANAVFTCCADGAVWWKNFCYADLLYSGSVVWQETLHCCDKPAEIFSEPTNSTEAENSLLALHEHRACLPAGHRLTPTRRTKPCAAIPSGKHSEAAASLFANFAENTLNVLGDAIFETSLRYLAQKTI